MSFQAAGDFARTAAAPAVVFPPLEAALNLVSNIEQSITLFKANRHEVKDLGNFSRDLARKLEKLQAPTSKDQTESFIAVIKDIQGFVVKVSQKKTIIQYFQRSTIAAKLAGFRKKLYDAFIAFNVGMQIDMSKAYNDAESARQDDQRTTNQSLDDISNNVSKIYAELGPITGGGVPVQLLKELEDTKAAGEGQTPQEQAILEESIKLLRVLDTNYDWWSKTFKGEFRRSDVVAVLASCIDDVCHGLGNLLVNGVRTRIAYKDPPEKVEILIRELNANHRNAVFIRSFQCELRNVKEPLVENLLVDNL